MTLAEQIAAGIILVIVTTFVSIIGYLIVRTLSQIDRNQTELFGRLQRIEIDVAKIQAHLDIRNDRLEL